VLSLISDFYSNSDSSFLATLNSQDEGTKNDQKKLQSNLSKSQKNYAQVSEIRILNLRFDNPSIIDQLIKSNGNINVDLSSKR
jgi:hypothetical protein